MKIDKKTIAIIILMGVSIFFFATWYFKGSDTKSRVKELELENKRLEASRDSIKEMNSILREKFKEIQSYIYEKDIEIKNIENDLSITRRELKNANLNIENSKKELSETKKKIENAKANPVKREDADLLNSLKEKLK